MKIQPRDSRTHKTRVSQISYRQANAATAFLQSANTVSSNTSRPRLKWTNITVVAKTHSQSGTIPASLHRPCGRPSSREAPVFRPRLSRLLWGDSSPPWLIRSTKSGRRGRSSFFKVSFACSSVHLICDFSAYSWSAFETISAAWAASASAEATDSPLPRAEHMPRSVRETNLRLSAPLINTRRADADHAGPVLSFRTIGPARGGACSSRGPASGGQLDGHVIGRGRQPTIAAGRHNDRFVR